MNLESSDDNCIKIINENKEKFLIIKQDNYYNVEEKLIDIIVENNKNIFILEKYSLPVCKKKSFFNNEYTSKIFKEFPVLYFKKRVFETKKIIPFIYELLYNLDDTKENKKDRIYHFNYFMYILYHNFRTLYTKYQTASLKYILDKFHKTEDLLSKIIFELKIFLNYYKEKKEIVFIELIILFFLEEFKEIYPKYIQNIKNEYFENDLDFCNIYNDKYINKIFVIIEDIEKELKGKVKKYSFVIKDLNLKEENKKKNSIDSISGKSTNSSINKEYDYIKELNDKYEYDYDININFVELLNKYSINNEKENITSLITEDENEANKSWKTNLLSLGLFLGFTGVMYLLSIKSK